MLRTFALPVILRREHALSSLEHLKRFEQSQYWSKPQLLDYQWQKLQVILHQAYHHTPYYRKVMDARGLTPKSFRSPQDLNLLPVLNRSMLEQNFESLIATNYRRADLQLFETGGTSSRRVQLYRDQESNNIKRAIAWRFESWMGRRPCDKMCYFWPPHIDYHTHESWKLRFRTRYLQRERMYYTGAATDATLRTFYDDMTAFKPSFLKVFPSGLYSFLDYVERAGLPLRPVKAIMSTGEILQGIQRRKFEEKFQCPVFDMYGSREVGNTSSQCGQHEGRHIAMETQIVEFLKDGRPVGPEEEGDVVVTDLTNLGFPLLRYQIHDFAMYRSEPCTCGRALPLMSAGIGRVSDNFIGRDGKRHSGLALEIYVLRTGPPIGQCQIVQRSLKDFLVRLVPDPRPSEAVYDHIRHAIRRVVGEDVDVTIELVAEIPKEKSGKIRLLKCEVDESEIPHADTDSR